MKIVYTGNLRKYQVVFRGKSYLFKNGIPLDVDSDLGKKLILQPIFKTETAKDKADDNAGKTEKPGKLGK